MATPSAPEKVNHKAGPDELQAAVAPAVHDLMDDLSQTTAPEVREAVVEAVAADVTPGHIGDAPLDMSRLVAQAIAEVYRQAGLSPPDAAALEAAALSHGVGVSGPIPGHPDQSMPLTTDEVKERVNKARMWERQILSHPSEKKQRTIDAIMSSPPMTFFSPEPRRFSVNTVTITVPEGEIKARNHTDRFGKPDGDITGCVYVARLVAEHSQARRMEMTEQRRLKETIIYGEVEDRPEGLSGIPTRGSIE
jgi:hypothetical protein